jgi:medium-chain acyl-[acyl-carrier-protein] hydrolase
MNIFAAFKALPEEKDEEWFAFLKPNSRARLRLFCFPYAGGGALAYRSWIEAVPREIEIFPVQLPGRENRFNEKPYTKLQPLMHKLLSAIRPYLDSPFAFFGHSLGAVLSFQLAQKMNVEGLDLPLHIFVSSRRAPHLPDLNPPLHNLPKSELIDMLKSFGGVPDMILNDPEVLDFFLPTLRADLYLSENCPIENGNPINCPITAFGGLQDPFTSIRELEAWRQSTCREFRLKTFPGGHFYIREFTKELLEEISHTLRKYLQDPIQAADATH